YVSYRFGDAILDLTTSYQPLLDEFVSSYGDASVPADSTALARVSCEAYFQEAQSILTLRFEVPPVVPHLADIALSLIRARAILEHLQPRDLEDGWRLIDNLRDPEAPLMIANRSMAVIDV